MAPSQPELTCPQPDFTVRSTLDDGTFPASREALISASAVFEDMFSTCSDDPQEQSLGLLEDSPTIIKLLQIIHSPPQPCAAGAESTDQITIPNLITLLALADKYQLKSRIMDTLHSHLQAHAPTSPMEVYALASHLDLPFIADAASKHLHRPPLAKWPEGAVRALPSADAFYRLLRLHTHRIEKFREILLQEDIFPHGYGNCLTHGPATTKLWTRARRNVSSRIDAGSDVGEEMRQILLTSVAHCQTCGMALNRTVDMLKYKCARVARSISRVTDDESA